ncbi:Prefoldin [Auriculariales sp. MPI-PUGE-AT-0066]|nr:Prefoldin [Auriculariales sp. MPI-PUGE-AT-0066]
MSLPDDTLRKVLFAASSTASPLINHYPQILAQIQQQSQQSQKAFSLAQAQTQAKQREQRMVQLTLKELESLKGDVTLYKGLGKAFMMVPRGEMESDLRSQDKELGDTITSLGKKSKFLEKQFNDAQNQMRDIFNSANRQ